MKKTLAIFLTFFTGIAFAADEDLYEVTVTNITKMQTFTPIIAATHKNRIAFFEAGQPASPELAFLAEDGATGPLQAVLESVPNLVRDVSGNPGMLLGPGESVTFRITTDEDRFRRFSLAAMLIPTNDTFVALNGVTLPRRSRTFFANAYDAGSEPNDELCANIPGPFCGGDGASEEAGGEGFVHISNGIHGVGDLAPSVYDWRNPVARVTITLIH